MADFMLLGLFNNVTPTADAVDGLRDLGIDDKNITIMSSLPYASKLFGRKTPRSWYLPFVLGGAVAGLLLGLFVAAITPELYPIEVGGQGATPIPPSAIIVFELTALFSMVAAFVAFLLQGRFPILTRQMYDPRITDGYIGLQVRVSGDMLDQAVKVLEASGARSVQREDAAEYRSQGIRHLLFWGGVSTAGLIALLIPLLLTYDVIRLPWINNMKDTPVVDAQEGPRRAVPAGSIPVQGPVLIAGQPATEPIPSSPESLQRGDVLYNINCAMCHGSLGGGDGLMTKYFPEVPALTDDRIQTMAAHDIFLVITNGKNRMPGIAKNLTAGETWDVINFVYSLDE
ncbi:MAG: DUF3341 domain-containing protein [Anaerolineae bacterium]|nr:DUF3341 domain-containing protein [Anaerolineae bacterium]